MKQNLTSVSSSLFVIFESCDLHQDTILRGIFEPKSSDPFFFEEFDFDEVDADEDNDWFSLVVVLLVVVFLFMF